MPLQRRSVTPARYARWANELSAAALWTHRYRECTVIQPTWFVSRATFDAVGGYWEEMAEDLQVRRRQAPLAHHRTHRHPCSCRLCQSQCMQFFMRFVAHAAGRVSVPLVKVDAPLLQYRHHGASACRMVTEERIRCARLARDPR